MLKYLIIAFLVIVALLAGCSKKLTVTRVEKFEAFYDQFHEDSTFQIQRVRFPLDGMYEGPEGTRKWSKENWQMHRQKVTELSDPYIDTDFRKEEGLVIERVMQRDGGYEAERRFRLIDGKWFLVYYQTVNL